MRLRIVTAVMLLSFLLTSLFTNQTSYAATVKPITDPFKPWTITFSQDVSDEDSNLQLITIQSKNEIPSLTISADSTKVIVNPTNPYLFKETYKLTIPAKFKASSGKVLNKEVTKEFIMTGKYIKDVSANLNPLATTISITTTSEITSASYSINEGSDIKLIRSDMNDFSKGQTGLAKGALLTIKVFDVNNTLMETQYYEVK